MNLFWFDENPVLNARYHCDKHAVKMPLEVAQMLSSAHHVNNSKYVDSVYRKTHVNHPCTLWISQSADAYYQALVMFDSLLDEYKHRYHRNHKSGELFDIFVNNPSPRVTSGPIPLAMPDEYKRECHVESYRLYFVGEKQRMAKWTNRPVPEWYTKLTER
jgi:hypothetical protein